MRDSHKHAGLVVLVLVIALGVAGWTEWTATVRSRQPVFDQASCDAAGDRYREVAARPITQLPELPIREAPTAVERRAFRVASEERSAQFAARGAALHAYARACHVGAAALEQT